MQITDHNQDIHPAIVNYEQHFKRIIRNFFLSNRENKLVEFFGTSNLLALDGSWCRTLVSEL